MSAVLYTFPRVPKGPRRLHQGKLLSLPAAIVSAQRARVLDRALPDIESLLRAEYLARASERAKKGGK